MKKYFPFALTTLRLFLGPLILFCALENKPRWIFLPMLVAGTLSDIFDGILARRFGVATPALRRYDSVADVIYYLFVLMGVWHLSRENVINNLFAIGLILFMEIAVVVVCYAKFRKYPSAHSWFAKFYGLCLLFCLAALLVFDASNWSIILLATVAVVTNLEILAMHLISDVPPVDVSSIFTLLKR